MPESRATASTRPSSMPPTTARAVSWNVSSRPFHRNGALLIRTPQSKPPCMSVGSDGNGAGDPRAILDHTHDGDDEARDQAIEYRSDGERLEGREGVLLDLARLRGQLEHADGQRQRGV